MRKFIIAISIFLTYVLIGCQKKELSNIESIVREYDQYATLVNYQEKSIDQEVEFVKVIAVFDERGLFYVIEVLSNFISPSLVLSVDHVEFKVIELTSNEKKIIILDALEIPSGEFFDLYLGSDNYSNIKNFNKDIKLVKDIKDIEKLHVSFYTTKGYQDKELKINVYNEEKDYFNTFLKITISSIVILFITLKSYKYYFQKHLERKLSDVTYKRKLVDINQFKVYSIGLISLLSLSIFLSIVFTNEAKIKNEIKFIDGTTTIETVSGFNQDINMKITIVENGVNNNTIIFERPIGGTDYDYEIIFDNENRSFIRLTSGIDVHKEVFENVNYKTFEIKVYDKYNNDELLLYRKYNLE